MLLNQKQVAKKRGVSERTICRWLERQAIPHYQLNGIIRFDEKVIDSWLEKRRVRVKGQID